MLMCFRTSLSARPGTDKLGATWTSAAAEKQRAKVVCVSRKGTQQLAEQLPTFGCATPRLSKSSGCLIGSSMTCRQNHAKLQTAVSSNSMSQFTPFMSLVHGSEEEGVPHSRQHSQAAVCPQLTPQKRQTPS